MSKVYVYAREALTFHSCGPGCCDKMPRGQFIIAEGTRLEVGKVSAEKAARLKATGMVPIFYEGKNRAVARVSLFSEREYAEHKAEQRARVGVLRKVAPRVVGEGGAEPS